MSEYRKKPVVVQAVQLKRDNLKEIETFLAGRVMPEMNSSTYRRRGQLHA